MLGILLRILLLILIIHALWRLLRGVLEGAGVTGRSREPLARGVGLVRDPVCGTFVVPQRALSAAAGGETHYFCSEKCLAEWRARA